MVHKKGLIHRMLVDENGALLFQVEGYACHYTIVKNAEEQWIKMPYHQAKKDGLIGEAGKCVSFGGIDDVLKYMNATR